MSSQSGEIYTSFQDRNEYSLSYYDYFTTGECTGFGWDLSNFTQDHKNSKFLLNPNTLLVLTLLVQPLVVIFGILGNVAFMFIVWKEPQMRNNMNLILLNLSVADLLYLIVGAGEKFVNTLYSPVQGDKMFFGKVGQCFIITTLLHVPSFASLLLVSFLSVERCFAVCNPLKHLRIRSRKRIFYYVSVIWLSSFVMTLCILPSYSYFLMICIKWPSDAFYANYPTKAAFCQPQGGYVWISISEIVQIFPFFIALVLNVVCFYKIISKLKKRKPPSLPGGRPNGDSFGTQQHKSSAHAATRMLLINGIVFFILATPLHVTNAIQFAEYALRLSFNLPLYKDFSILLLYVNSAVNPFIYGATNQAYREAYQNVFCKRRPKNSQLNSNKPNLEMTSSKSSSTLSRT